MTMTAAPEHWKNMARRTADVGAVLIRPSHRGTSTITVMIKVRRMLTILASWHLPLREELFCHASLWSTCQHNGQTFEF